jgi:hypothetical protein
VGSLAHHYPPDIVILNQSPCESPCSKPGARSPLGSGPVVLSRNVIASGVGTRLGRRVLADFFPGRISS